MKRPLKDLLRTSNLSSQDLTAILDLAVAYKHDPLQHHDALRGESVVQFFAKHSTRTRISFETAIARLGAVAITTTPNDLQLGRGETIEDTARTISQYSSAFIIRTYKDSEVRRFAQAASIPVINALTDGHHPCQSLADMLTVRERFGSLAHCRIAFVGDGYNVAHSLIEAAALMGVDMAIATPQGYEPDPEVVAWCRSQLRRSGGRLTLTNDPIEAVHDAHAVYTDVWFSMGEFDELERATRINTFMPFRVDQAMMAHARADAIFMHCLPAHRGEEVTPQVIDGAQSVVFQQAANRLPIGQAVLYALTKGKLTGAEPSSAELG